MPEGTTALRALRDARARLADALALITDHGDDLTPDDWTAIQSAAEDVNGQLGHVWASLPNVNTGD
jgi:hypothetical protein